MNETPTKVLCQFAVTTELGDLSQAVIHETKRILLDTLGCSIMGSGVDKGKISAEIARVLGGPQEATILGFGDRVSCTNAAFANGELMNALDFDPILAPGHVSAVVIPAALAFAEREHSCGADLLVALAIGQEIASRIGGSLPSARAGKTYPPARHGNGACVFGAVTAVGKVLRLDLPKMVNAFGLAGALTPIPIGSKWHHSQYTPMFKYGSAGWAALCGAMGALLSEFRYLGDDSILDGPYGFWHMYGAESCRWETMTQKLGEEWFLLRTAYKPYPSAGLVNPLLDAFSQILDRHNLTPEEIEKVILKGERMGLLPVYHVEAFRSHMDAQFNPAYNVAMIAYRISPSEWQNKSLWKDLKISNFMKKVRFEEYAKFEESRYQEMVIERQPYIIKRPAFAEVTARGRSFTAEVEYPKWGPSVVIPIRATDEGLIEKFRLCTSKVLSSEKVEKAIESVFSLETLDDISSLVQNLRK